MMRKRDGKYWQRGMSLLEMMVVLGIMALIVSITAPRVIGYFGRAKTQAAEVQMVNIKSALQLYYIDMGRYPTTAEGLGVLINNVGNNSRWKGPYINSLDGLKDSWGREYKYTYPNENGGISLISYGRDGQLGGNKEDGDISLSE